MLEAVYNFFSTMNSAWATLFLSMLPITELRGSIPFAIGYFHMTPWLAFLISIIGDIIPAIFIIWLLEPIAKWLSQNSNFFKKIFDWWFNRIVKSFSKKFEKYGPWALMIFVAIPLPITGAWTGSVASFLFKIPRKKALLFVSLGVVIAGLIVTLLSAGIFSLI